MSKKILFFGNERLATGVHTTAPTLRALIAGGYEITAVVVAQSQNHQSRHKRELEVAKVARQHGIPLLMLSELNAAQAQDQLAVYQADIAILIAYGKLIPEVVLNLFPAGIINIHPSLLPLHRGPTPLESAILSGARETGVSLMRLIAKMDAGPVYVQQKIALSGNETKQALADQLSIIGSDMLVRHLPAILDGSLQPSAQNEAEASYDRLITKTDGVLDWTKPATVLEREIRAFSGWPRSRTVLGNTPVIITTTHVITVDQETDTALPGTLWLGNGKQLGMYCIDGILVIDTLIPPGKKEMSVSAFLAGHQLD
jgi:methionyl-tRNA formyltransferase